MENKNLWYFGETTDGTVQGANSGAGELFAGKDILSATVKEIIQNSLDAQRSPDRTVAVTFDLFSVQTTSIPGYSDLRLKMQDALRYWERQGKNETSEILKKRLDILKSQKIYVLAVSDTNTKGLSEPMNDDIRCGDWNALVKMNGGGTKTGNKNGSKGLGKNAPFALSTLGMVFYRTINLAGERAAQGVIHLVSHPTNSSSRSNAFYNSVGYFGERQKPLRQIDWLNMNGHCFRKDTGTDVIIVGFPDANVKKWESTVIAAVLENYMFAIQKGNLTVHVGKQSINQGNLEKRLLEANKNKKIRTVLSFYRSITDPKAMVQKFSIKGLEGSVVAHYLFESPETEELVPRILYTRQSGMKLFDKSTQAAVPYCAVVEMEGSELNQYFRALEPATHDRWRPDLAPGDSHEAEERINFIRSMINETADKLCESSNMESVDLEFFGEKEELTRKTQMDKKGVKPLQTRGTSFLTRDPKSRVRIRKQPRKEKGTVTSNGGLPAVKSFEGTRKERRKTTTQRRGVKTVDGNDEIQIQVSEPVAVKRIQSRAIALKSGRTRLVLYIPEEIKNADISVRAMGDGANGYPVHISKIASCKGIEQLSLTKGARSIHADLIEPNRLIAIEFVSQISLKNRSLHVFIEGE